MTRYCSGCASEVEVTNGACLLGHAVTEGSARGSMAELRAQVDAAFAEAATEVAGVLTANDVARSAGLEDEPKIPVSAAPPPPPPSGLVAGGGHRDIPNETFIASGSDPIAAFGPPPRMDWGPRRLSLLRLRRDETR